MLDNRYAQILNFVRDNQECSSKEIYEGILNSISYATVKRILSNLISENLINAIGKGKGTKYVISQAYELFLPINAANYFEKEIDDREIKGQQE